MTNHNYRKGADFERKIANKLRAKGYLVIRSAGTKSLVDLVALDLKVGKIMLIQLKNYKLTKPEFERMSAEIRKLAPQPSAEVSFYALEHTGRGTDRMTLIR